MWIIFYYWPFLIQPLTFASWLFTSCATREKKFEFIILLLSCTISTPILQDENKMECNLAIIVSLQSHSILNPGLKCINIRKQNVKKTIRWSHNIVYTTCKKYLHVLVFVSMLRIICRIPPPPQKKCLRWKRCQLCCNHLINQSFLEKKSMKRLQPNIEAINRHKGLQWSLLWGRWQNKAWMFYFHLQMLHWNKITCTAVYKCTW